MSVSMRPVIGLAMLSACAGVEPALPLEPPASSTVSTGYDTAVPGSGTETTTEPKPFRSATYCAECHPQQFEEWEQSMHRYAAHSPVFDAMATKAWRDSAGQVGTFCTGCHSPMGTDAGEPGDTVAANRSSLSLEGVSCDVCHSASSHPGPIGNVSLTLDPTGPVQGPFEDAMSVEHASEASDFLQSPELCGSCHDVFNFPGLRIEEAYTEYTESPAAAEHVRCQDCHMSPDPGVYAERPVGPIAIVDGIPGPDRPRASHRFVGPDVPLIDTFPWSGDPEGSLAAREEALSRTQQLMENAVRLASADITTDGTRQTLSVALQSLVSGHRVPTGFTSERQLWVSVTVIDDTTGRIVFESGDLDEYGDLRDDHSWEVAAGSAALDSQLVNLQSKNLLRSGSFDEVDVEHTLDVEETVFPFDADYIERHSLLPLERREVSYTYDAVPGPHTVRIGLHYRSLPPYVLRTLGVGELVDVLPTFTIDTIELRR